MLKNRGNVPDSKDGWKEVQKIKLKGATWIMFVQQQRKSASWLNFKLVAARAVCGRANFWVVRNVDSGAFAYTRDLAVLHKTHPELYSWAVSVFDSFLSQPKTDL